MTTPSGVLPLRKGPPKGPEKKGMSTRKRERLRSQAEEQIKRKGTQQLVVTDSSLSVVDLSPNTYIMEPTEPFNRTLAQDTLDMVFQAALQGFKYTSEEASILAKSTANSLIEAFRELNFERHKLVCCVDLVENLGQEYVSVAKHLIDVDHDDYVTTTQKNMYFFASATMYGLYFE